MTTLADLQPGDEVAIIGTRDDQGSIHRIKRRMPTFIELENGKHYSPKDGTRLLPKGAYSSALDRSTRLVPVTDAIRNTIRRSHLASHIHTIHINDWQKMSLQTLEGITALIDLDPWMLAKKKGETR